MFLFLLLFLLSCPCSFMSGYKSTWFQNERWKCEAGCGRGWPEPKPDCLREMQVQNTSTWSRHLYRKFPTVCPRSSEPFYMLIYYIRCVTTSWTDGMLSSYWMSPKWLHWNNHVNKFINAFISDSPRPESKGSHPNPHVLKPDLDSI